MQEILPSLCDEHSIDLVVGNGENAAGGLGLTPNTAEELFDSGIDVITTGNHIWAYNEIIPYLESELAILRPLNYPPMNPGRGHLLKNNVLIVSLIGRVFMGHVDCPFRAMDQLLVEFKHKSIPIIVDFHAEAYLDGRVSAVVGTHTHVGTADARILPGGTAYVTDIGMVGPMDSVIGDDPDSVIKRFLTQIPSRLSVGRGTVSFDAILVEVDEKTGKAVGIQRIQKVVY